jgi:hypothetical protein
MNKRTITKWLPEVAYKNKDEFYRYFKVDLEEIYSRLVDSGATYCEIADDEVDFYTLTEETDEEYNRRKKSEETAKITVEKFEFKKAKETYLRLKGKYDN